MFPTPKQNPQSIITVKNYVYGRFYKLIAMLISNYIFLQKNSDWKAVLLDGSAPGSISNPLLY